MAGDAGVGVGKVKGKKGGEPAEGAGRVIMIGSAEDEGVVGAAVGAGRARAGAKHGGSLCVKARASLRWGERRHRGDTGHRHGGCWGDYSRCGRMSSGCDERTLWMRAMRRGEGQRLVTPLAVLAAR